MIIDGYTLVQTCKESPEQFYNKRLMLLKTITMKCEMVTFILLNLAGMLVARALIVGGE